MNTKQIIKDDTDTTERMMKAYSRWNESYVKTVTRFQDVIEQLPCCTQECDCPAMHLEGWSVTQGNVLDKFVVAYTPSQNETITPVNDIRTAVCRAIGTTLAKRTFNTSKGQADFVIEHQGIEVTLKGATMAPNCEIVPVTKTVELTTFEIVCPDGQEPDEMVEALETKESVTNV